VLSLMHGIHTIHCQSSISHLLSTQKELARPLEGPPGCLTEGMCSAGNKADTADGAERSEKPILQQGWMVQHEHKGEWWGERVTYKIL